MIMDMNLRRAIVPVSFGLGHSCASETTYQKRCVDTWEGEERGMIDTRTDREVT